MRTSSADRVMKTVTRFFEVATQDTDRTCKAEDAAWPASADPRTRDALARLLEEAEDRASRAGVDPELCDALTRVFEEDCPRGSVSACTHVSHGDGGADVIAWLPDAECAAGQVTECSAGQVHALQAKVRDAAGSDPGTGSCLVLLMMAAIHVDRSSLGTADAWSLRREPSAGDIAAVRKTLRRLTAADVTFPPPLPPTAAEGEGERREPQCPVLAPDPLRASTPADLAAALERFRRRAGEPSFREMARHARPAVSPSTLAAAVHAERLPTLRVVSAFVTGCGGGPEELARFATAWRRIRLCEFDRPTA
jgi:hypothetical protein